MELQERITYDSHEFVQMMESRLDRLKLFQFDARYRSLLGEGFVRKLADWERNIRSRREDPFTLVVCGEFKRGKSSLINALLGEDVVTTNVTTETVTLNRICYGPHSNEALFSGGRRLRLSDEELQKDRLEEVMRQTKEEIRRLELRRPIELLKQVTIIDTPGLGDSLKDFGEMVEQALSQADAVIYVFSVQYPLSQGEQLFLKTEILPQKYTDLFLAGNYADVLRDEKEYGRMRELLSGRVRGLLPGQRVWMLSALDERCRQKDEDRPNARMAERLGDTFTDFREEISRRVADRQETVLPDRMQRLLGAMSDDLSANLEAMEQGLLMSSQDVQAAMERLNEKCSEQAMKQEEAARRIDDRVKSMQAEAYEWIGEVLDRLRAETDTLTEEKAEDLIKYYSFYCIDTLQEAMNRCTETHRLQLYEELEEISRDLVKGLSGRDGQNDYSFRFALDNRTWTKGDNVSYVISKLPMGFLAGLAADGIAGAMRQKEMGRQTPELLKKIKEQYEGLRASALKAVEDTYRGMAERVKKQLSEYYGEQVSAAREQAEQSAMVARQDEEKKGEIRNVIGQIRSELEEMVKWPDIW